MHVLHGVDGALITGGPLKNKKKPKIMVCLSLWNIGDFQNKSLFKTFFKLIIWNLFWCMSVNSSHRFLLFASIMFFSFLGPLVHYPIKYFLLKYIKCIFNKQLMKCRKWTFSDKQTNGSCGGLQWSLKNEQPFSSYASPKVQSDLNELLCLAAVRKYRFCLII